LEGSLPEKICSAYVGIKQDRNWFCNFNSLLYLSHYLLANNIVDYTREGDMIIIPVRILFEGVLRAKLGSSIQIPVVVGGNVGSDFAWTMTLIAG
jgi:hypothetical protein